MSSSSTFVEPRSAPRWRYLLPPVVGAATTGLVWCLAGDLSESAVAYDPDYLWRPWDALIEHERLIGGVAAVVVSGSILALLLMRRHLGAWAMAPVLAATAAFALLGAWVGVGYRVVTAAVVGANIGGGMVILATPALVFVELVAAVVWRSRRRQRQRAGELYIPGA